MDAGRVREALSMRPCFGALSRFWWGKRPVRRAGGGAAHLRHLLGRNRWRRRARWQPVGSGAPPPRPAGSQPHARLPAKTRQPPLFHFYLFFMPTSRAGCMRAAPGLARPCSASPCWRHMVCGEQVRAALVARARWLELMGALGRRSHTSAILLGGSSRTLRHRRATALRRAREMRDFPATPVVWMPAAGNRVAADLVDELLAALERAPEQRRGLRALAAGLAAGHARARAGRLLSYRGLSHPRWRPDLGARVWYAAFAAPGAGHWMPSSEDVQSSWMHAGRQTATPRHPDEGSNRAPDKPGAYTWNKAPRWAELRWSGNCAWRARWWTDSPGARRVRAMGRPGAPRVLARSGGNAALCCAWNNGWAPAHPSLPPPAEPVGAGRGPVRSQRGALGHWLRGKMGVSHHQIIAPPDGTKPRDQRLSPGALEAALVGAPGRSDDPR